MNTYNVISQVKISTSYFEICAPVHILVINASSSTRTSWSSWPHCSSACPSAQREDLDDFPKLLEQVRDPASVASLSRARPSIRRFRSILPTSFRRLWATFWPSSRRVSWLTFCWSPLQPLKASMVNCQICWINIKIFGKTWTLPRSTFYCDL